MGVVRIQLVKKNIIDHILFVSLHNIHYATYILKDCIAVICIEIKLWVIVLLSYYTRKKHPYIGRLFLFIHLYLVLILEIQFQQFFQLFRQRFHCSFQHNLIPLKLDLDM